MSDFDKNVFVKIIICGAKYMGAVQACIYMQDFESET